MWSGNLRQRLQGHRVQPTDPVQGAEHVLSFLEPLNPKVSPRILLIVEASLESLRKPCMFPRRDGANCTIDNGLVGFTVRSHSAKARWKSMIRGCLFQALKVL